jgi:hypothetical protein
MSKVINLYIDDSGTRHPDHKPSLPKHGHDYFAFGGILIKQEDEQKARELYSKLCARWEINSPLHSVEIRNKTKNFKWIGKLNKDEQSLFIEELYTVLSQSPLMGVACVIDRPGYNYRYREKYGRERWSLCKTAFKVLVERAAKYADSQAYKLRVLPEKCNPQEDRVLKGYYDDLKTMGMPFSQSTSSKYRPLEAKDFKRLLYEFKLKEKTSPMIQLADLYLWPMAIGGYDQNNRTYQRLLEDGKLIDNLYSQEEILHLGIKYSCFDLVYAQSAEA